MTDRKILILLATYNGDKFIGQQLDSIACQTEKNWHILARDDGSKDDTQNKILNHVAKEKITIIHNKQQQLGCTQNFSYLMQTALSSDANYFVLCDQDDVWNQEKLKLLVDKLIEIEITEPGTPVLAFSDMSVIDEKNKIIAKSFGRYQHLNFTPENPLASLLTRNYISGCSLMMNRKLLQVSAPIPSQALLHDWWIALCAAAIGKIVYIDQPLVNYRKHSNNVIGPKSIRQILKQGINSIVQQWLTGRSHLKKSFTQASVLHSLLSKHHTEYSTNLRLVKEYSSLNHHNIFIKFYNAYTYKLFPDNTLQKLYFISKLSTI